MAEYIAKGQVIEWFRPYGHTDKGIPYFVLVTDIREMKAADVAPVRHGRWMREETEGGFHTWGCSRCGRGMPYNPEGIDLYCYHCGAKMDGDSDES